MRELNPDVLHVLVAGCVIAVLLLCAFTAGFVRGSDAGRKLVRDELKRDEALARIKAANPAVLKAESDRLLEARRLWAANRHTTLK